MLQDFPAKVQVPGVDKPAKKKKEERKHTTIHYSTTWIPSVTLQAMQIFSEPVFAPCWCFSFLCSIFRSVSRTWHLRREACISEGGTLTLLHFFCFRFASQIITAIFFSFQKTPLGRSIRHEDTEGSFILVPYVIYQSFATRTPRWFTLRLLLVSGLLDGWCSLLKLTVVLNMSLL